MEFSRNYLTSEELAFIVNEVCKHDNAVEREIVKVGLVAQLVVKDLGEFENCNDVYDYVIAQGDTIDFYDLENYHVLEDLIDQETGIVKVIKDFVNDISEKLAKSMDNLDLNGAVEQLKEIADKGDIIQNAVNKPIPKGKKAK